MPETKLYYGDNLDVLRRYVRDESVEAANLRLREQTRSWAVWLVVGFAAAAGIALSSKPVSFARRRTNGRDHHRF